jgi:hypothetical protein
LKSRSQNSKGIPLFNFPAFDKAAKIGRALGWEVISPAELDRAIGFDEHTTTELTPQFVRECAARDTQAILSLKAENGDAIALLPRWYKSDGTKAELALATWLGLKTLCAGDFIPVITHLDGWWEYAPLSEASAA